MIRNRLATLAKMSLNEDLFTRIHRRRRLKKAITGAAIVKVLILANLILKSSNGTSCFTPDNETALLLIQQGRLF